MRYPGGKNFVYRSLINLIPAHGTYIEPFLGSGAVIRNKQAAKRSIGIDIDRAVISKAKSWPEASIELIIADGISFLEEFSFQGNEFVYCDPPYVHSTRRSSSIYKHELTDEDHSRLIAVIQKINCKVMISGYGNEIYESALNNWNVISLNVPSHVGLRKECLWLNYETPEIPFDLRFIGNNFREREQIKRRHQRLLAKIDDMPAAERALLLRAVGNKYSSEISLL